MWIHQRATLWKRGVLGWWKTFGGGRKAMLSQSRCWGRMKLSQSFSANARMNLTQALTVLAWKSQRQTTTSTSSHALFFWKVGLSYRRNHCDQKEEMMRFILLQFKNLWRKWLVTCIAISTMIYIDHFPPWRNTSSLVIIKLNGFCGLPLDYRRKYMKPWPFHCVSFPNPEFWVR